jgi:hypothetical protein
MLKDPEGFQSALDKEEHEIETARLRQEEGKRREQLKRKQIENELSELKIQTSTKPCPGCTRPIEKNDGCSHMTCKPP